MSFRRVSFIWLAALAPCAAAPPGMLAQQPYHLAVTVECGSSKTHASDAVLTWNLPAGAPDQTRIRVSIYKNGFDRGFYATIVHSLHATHSLVFSDSSPDRDKTLRSYKLLAEQPTIAVSTRLESAERSATMRVNGLQGGVNYFWQLQRRVRTEWVSDSVVRVQMPPCDHREHVPR